MRFLPFFCFSSSFRFPCDVPSVALRSDVFPDGGNGLSGDDFRTDGRLQGNHELLPWNEFLQLDADLLAEVVGVVPVDQGTQSIDLVSVQQDVHLHQVALLVAVWEVVEGRVSAGDGFQLVVKVKDDFPQGHAEGEFHPV